MGILEEEASTIFISFLFCRSQLLKERICSSGSKFFLLRVDPNVKELLHLEKQTEIHARYITLFLEKREGTFIGAGTFIDIYMVGW